MQLNFPMAIIGAALGWGAQHHETQAGPEVIKQRGLLDFLKLEESAYLTTLTPQTVYQIGRKLSYQEKLVLIAEFNQRLAQLVKTTIAEYKFPVILGGDHSIGIGTWSGVVNAYQAHQHFGLIWIDAHMDSHTHLTTPSHAIHGMPLAALMGHGEEVLINVSESKVKLSPQHVVLIGVRSFEEGEAKLLKELNVKVYFMKEVKERGFKAVFQEALNIVGKVSLGFGLSIDLDAFDPIDAPGVGSPEKDGLRIKEVSDVFKNTDFKRLRALEITEYNPTFDKDYQTASLAQALINNIVTRNQ